MASPAKGKAKLRSQKSKELAKPTNNQAIQDRPDSPDPLELLSSNTPSIIIPLPSQTMESTESESEIIPDSQPPIIRINLLETP